MRILGIGEIFHDNGLSLIDNGKVVFALNEERLSRRKFDVGIENCFDYCFNRLGITAESIDLIAVAGLHGKDYRERMLLDFKVVKKGKLEALGKAVALGMAHEAWHERLKTIFKKYNLSGKPISYVEHHLAHAAGAYVGMGKENAFVFTADGWGDGYSGGCFKCSDGKIEDVHKILLNGSAGGFYSSVTSMMGFNAMRHAGKITGLAAYGTSSTASDCISKLLIFENGTTVLDENYIKTHGKTRKGIKFCFHTLANVLKKGKQGILDSICEEILNATPAYHTNSLKKLLNNFSREDIAFGFQKTLEKTMCEYIKHYLPENESVYVGLAGGVFANVRLNQFVCEMNSVKDIYIFPNMGDGGLSLGAAYYAWLKENEKINKPYEASSLDNVYLGYKAEDKDINNAIEKYKDKISFKRHDDPCKAIAECLANKEVVGRYAGAMEYGPRALGNRSILYCADDVTVNDWLNARLKRTEFMPFAPSVLADKTNNYFILKDSKGERAAEFMTITFDCTEEMKRVAPAAVHVDGTARPQLVKKETNPGYYEVISKYYELTGVPIVLNTSFNMHEEPIVCIPEDAIRAFLAGACDVLFIEDFEITHKSVQN